MAKNKCTIYLGFEDEEITGKHAPLLSSKISKVGGTADWHGDEIKVPACPLCSTIRPLIAQLYAPLEQSQFHRTLYVFACLNPLCSPNSKSWLCIRTQYLESNVPYQPDLINEALNCSNGKKMSSQKKASVTPAQKVTWCSGADDWGEEEMDTEIDDFQNQNEQNGNVVAKIDNSPLKILASGSHGSIFIQADDDDDDEDESTSMENDLICGFSLLDMHTQQNATEDPNANCAGDMAAAAVDGTQVGNAATASIFAEIEDSETDFVLVETPKRPQRDLIALLKHTQPPAVMSPLGRITDLTLKSFFIGIDVETQLRQKQYETYISSDHVSELYHDYKCQDDAGHSPNSGSGVSGINGLPSGGANGADDQESYEKSTPAHGDLIFHKFITTLQQNPGQIIRYTRDAHPLLTALLSEPVPKCPNCNGDTICEVQILSTLISKLRLQHNSEPAPIEYGNVLVFTCIKSCWDTPDKMRYERIIVQAEKL